MSSRLPNSDCIAWLAVLILECLAIVILNIITIIVFCEAPPATAPEYVLDHPSDDSRFLS